MILLKENQIVQGDTQTYIVRWEVWFRIPVGITRSFGEAQVWCEKQGMEPNLTIIPVAVAIGSALNSYEAVG